MATFQGKRVSRDWHTVLTQAVRDGVRFSLTSGKRTLREQWALYRKYLNGTGNLAAYPSPFAPHIRTGRQDHALDVNSLDGGETRLQNYLEHRGLDMCNPVSGESWHMEAVSGRALRKEARQIRRYRKRVAARKRKRRA